MQNEVISNLQKEIEARQRVLAFIEEKGLGSDAIIVRNVEAGTIDPAEVYVEIVFRIPTSEPCPTPLETRDI